MLSLNRTYRVLIAALVILLSLSLYSQTVGKIDYLEGIVDIHRAGEVVELFPEDIGYSLGASDTIQTGDDGLVDFSLSTLQRRGTTIHVGSDTTFRVESSMENGASRTRLEVLSGNISLKVAKLTGNESLTVRTESAAMGVRGTRFEVVTAPDGGVLVLCDEGRVSCQDLNWQEVMAYPGQAVEKVPGDPVASLDVNPSDFDEYRAAWKKERLEIFRSGAPVFLKAYIQQFQRVDPRFEAAVAKLSPFEERLKRYSSGEVTLGRGDFMRFRAEISSPIGEMRSVLPFYRQTFFRLQELNRYVDRDGIGQNVQVGDVSANSFFRNFAARFNERRRQIARVEYWFQLYRDLSGSESDPFGEESLMDDLFSPQESSLLEEF